MTDLELKREIERLITICGIGKFSKALVEASTINKYGMEFKVSYFPIFWDKVRDIYLASDKEIQVLYNNLIEKGNKQTLK